MNRLPEQIQPLPRVAAPLVWSWRYFRVHYLPTVASTVVVVAAVLLWSMNLPESTGTGGARSASGPAEEITDAQRQANGSVGTGRTEVTILTNENPGMLDGLVEKE